MTELPLRDSSRFGHLRARAALLLAAIAGAGLAGCGAAPQRETAGSRPPATTPACPSPPVVGPLFLRGSMTNWALDDDYTFQYQCDAYVLNVNLAGTQRFRISDAASSPAATFGGAPRTGAAPVARHALPLRRVS